MVQTLINKYNKYVKLLSNLEVERIFFSNNSFSVILKTIKLYYNRLV